MPSSQSCAALPARCCTAATYGIVPLISSSRGRTRKPRRGLVEDCSSSTTQARSCLGCCDVRPVGGQSFDVHATPCYTYPIAR